MAILVSGCDSGKSNSDTPDTPDTPEIIGAPINLTLRDESHYFILADPNDSTAKFFTRSGEFYINDSGKVSDINGYLLVRSLGFNQIQSYPILIPNLEAGPRATQTISVSLNLPSDAIQKTTGGIDAEFNSALATIPISTVTPSTSNYNYSASTFIIDSIGNAHTLTTYFILYDALSLHWDVRATIDGYPLMVGGTLAGPFAPKYLDFFDISGELDESASQMGGVINFDHFNLIDADVLRIAVDYRQSISKPLPFEIYSVVQDGSLSVKVTELTVSEEGNISVNYNDLETRLLYRIPLASFENVDELIQITDSVWEQNPDMSDLTIDIIYPESGDLVIESPLVIDLEAVLNN